MADKEKEMSVFTSCKSCCFCADNDARCSLGKWASPGFKNLVDKDGSGRPIVKDRICSFHRTSEWREKQAENGLTASDAVDSETRLRYALVCSLSTPNHKAMLSTIKSLFASERPPTSLYVVDDRAGAKADEYEMLKSTGEHEKATLLLNRLKIDTLILQKELTELKLDTRDPFIIKRVMGQRELYKSIDEFVMTGKIKDPFYISIADSDFDFSFLEGLDSLIYKDMHQVLFAGNDDYYFIPTKLHELVRGGFKQHLESLNKEGDIYGYKELCDSTSKLR